MDERLSLILIHLLVKLGVAAAIAAAVVRSVEFKSLLFRGQRSLRDRIYLVLWLVDWQDAGARRVGKVRLNACLRRRPLV